MASPGRLYCLLSRTEFIMSEALAGKNLELLKILQVMLYDPSLSH